MMMMTRNAIVLLGTIGLLACSRDRVDKPGTTTTTGASTDTTQRGTQPTSQPQIEPTSQQGGTMGSDHGAVQQGSQGAGSMQAGTHTKNTEAVRGRLKQDKAAPEAVLTELIISDDGSMIILSGEVPDQNTRDAVVKSAKKAPGVKGVQDNLQIKKK